MHIELFTVRNRPYLRLVESRRRMSRNGKPISGKRLVLSLGPLAKHDDGKPGYLDRLRQSFREGKPLIEALGPYVGDAPREEWDIKFRDGDDGCNGEPKRLAACVLDPVFSALGLDQLFASVKHASKIRYDLQGLVRLLVYGRILEPASKCATMEQNGTYHEPLVSSDNPDNVYDALTVIDENAEKVFRRMNTCIKRGIGRNPSLVFYDVTNFYFEIAEADEDVLDESGNVVERGLRKFGVSKENRKQPIVQIGLFMDDNGIPVSFEMFPGNTLDHHTLRPAMERTVDGFGLVRTCATSRTRATATSSRRASGRARRRRAGGRSRLTGTRSSATGSGASPGLSSARSRSSRRTRTERRRAKGASSRRRRSSTGARRSTGARCTSTSRSWTS